MSRPAAALMNDPVTAHIRKEAATLRPDWTVADALDHMRASPPAGRIIYFYVTDGDAKLVGVVPTRRLLLAKPDAPLREVMIRGVIAVPATATVLEACEFFTLHRLLAFPVIDPDKKLLGVIDVDLYTDELTGSGDTDVPPRANDDVFELIGVHLADAAQGNPVKGFYGRFPWLLCNIGGGLAAAVLAGLFEDVLTWRNAVLALFIPVVLGLCESVAMQSVTLAVGRLRTQGVNPERAGRRGLVEAATGLLLGAGSAGLVAVIAGLWLRDATVAGVLFGAIGFGVAAAAVIGFAVPTFLHRLRWNPQVAAGPVALAAADMVTLLGYFGLARAVA